MLLLAAADVIYGDYFPSYSDQWRNGPICEVASILSILSSELSVFFITLVSTDFKESNIHSVAAGLGVSRQRHALL